MRPTVFMPCSPAIRKTDWRPISITRRRPTHSTAVAAVIQEPRGAAAAWLAQVRDAAGDLERSEQLAREDIRLAEQAQSEISECSSAIRRAQSSGWVGIYPEIGNAQAQLIQAEQLLQSQKYEQSIQSPGLPPNSPVKSITPRCSKPCSSRWPLEAEQRRRAARLAAPSGDGISFGAAAATAAAATNPRERGISRSRSRDRRRIVGPRNGGGKLVSRLG